MSNTISGNYSSGYDLTNPALNPVTVTGTIALGTGGLFAALQGETVATWNVTNQGSIVGGTGSGIDLLAGGSVTNAASASITGFFGVAIEAGPAVVTNSGSIGGNAGGAGVFLSHGGSVTNLAGGHIQSAGDGVTTENAAASVLNAGVINAGTAAAAIDLLLGGSATILATGSLNGDWGVSIEGSATGSVQNAGVVIGGAQSGVFLTGGTVTDLASGTLSGNWGVADVNAAGTVITSGTIIGTNGTAVTLPSGYANRVLDNPGAVFTGKVDGGNTIGASIVSTLELGAAPLRGTLTALGTQFLDFGLVAIDPGASWALTGVNAGIAGQTLVDQGTLAVSTATLTGAATLLVGEVGAAWFQVNNLGNASVSNAVLGVSAAGSGSFDLDGPGSGFSAGLVTVGQAGAGYLTVENQATAQTGGSKSGGIDVAQLAGGAGDVTVTGANSRLTNTGQFIVGDAGLGSLAVERGGSVITSPGSTLPGAVIANTASASGSTVNVSGAGSNWQVGGQLNVGAAGSGALQLSGGATVTAGSLDAGVSAAGVGQISLSGSGTGLSVTGDATVADDGTGVLSVLNGATFSATNLTVGSQGDSSGALVVSGDGSMVQLSGALNIGTALGTGDLTVGPGAAVHASVVNLQGQVVLEGGLLDPTVQLINQGQTAGGFGTIAAGDIVDEGVIQAGGNKASQRLLLVQGNVLGGGTLTANGTQPGSNPTGVLQINAAGTIELTGAVINAATTTFTDNLTPTGTYSVNNSVIDVTFADAAGVLKLDDIAEFGGTITAHQAGDSFVVSGGSLSGLNVANGNTLTFSDSGAGAGAGGIDNIIFASAINASGFNIVNGNTVQVACFAAGTRIATETGIVAVEDLRVGDRVITMDRTAAALLSVGAPAAGDPPMTANDAGYEVVVWMGQRAVHCKSHPKPETVWPVRVRAGAFGQNVPVRDLYLSPDHAVLVNGVLVPVKLLLNGTSIARMKRDRVTYFHVELPRHAVILAEGLPVESYLDLDDRANFNQVGETIRLFPDFAARLAPDAAVAWETRGAARLVTTGPELAAARRMVALNASRRDRRRMRHASHGS